MKFIFFQNMSYLWLLLALIKYASTCFPGVTTLGHTIPKGDINLEYGFSLEIFCVLDSSSDYNASLLQFYENENPVPSEIVNSKTIKLYIEKPEPSHTLYFCKLKSDVTKIVCFNIVTVGFKPFPVENFGCVSKNWENLNCSWTTKPNFVKTKYFLKFQLKKSNQLYECPRNNNYCFLDFNSDPPYRSAHQTYYFQMSAVNALGNLFTEYVIDNYKAVIPNKVEKLSLKETTAESMLISWSLPEPIGQLPSGIISKIMYKSNYDHDWISIEVSGLTCNLTSLYSNCMHKIKVLIKPNIDGSKWSEPNEKTFKTRATIPRFPPETNIGSFEIFNSNVDRDVIIYWKEIPQYFENGPHFCYQIFEIEELIDQSFKKRNIKPLIISRTWAKIKNLSFNRYKFKIVSKNEEGVSKNFSEITLPSKKEAPNVVTSISQVAFSDEIYEISWNKINVDNYTIFWCETRVEKPNCEKNLDWLTTTCTYNCRMNITLPERMYQIGVAANKAFSSGMVWTKCTALPENAGNKITDVWINDIGSTFIELQWKLECFMISRIIEGFVISYCNLESCEPQNVTIIGGPAVKKKTLKYLKPFTTYKIQIATYYNYKTGMWSDALINQTLEAAPKAPEFLHVLDIKNTSVSLSWKRPSSTNGILRYYLLQYNGNQTLVNDNSTIVHKNLTNLKSNTKYEIKLLACTITCSKQITVKLSTKIGIPEKLNRPILRFMNPTMANVTWFTEDIDLNFETFYSLRVIVGKTEKYFHVKNSSVMVKLCEKNEPYKLQVRAVQVEDNVTLHGYWSDISEANCFRSDTIFLHIVISIVTIAIFFMLIVGVRCLWYHYKAMKDIQIALPPQLLYDHTTQEVLVVERREAEDVESDTKVDENEVEANLPQENLPGAANSFSKSASSGYVTIPGILNLNAEQQ